MKRLFALVLSTALILTACEQQKDVAATSDDIQNKTVLEENARDAYDNLHDAYQNAGLSDSQIDEVLKLEIPDNEYFNSRGIYNYHGGGSLLFEDESILNWILLHELNI